MLINFPSLYIYYETIGLWYLQRLRKENWCFGCRDRNWRINNRC